MTVSAPVPVPPPTVREPLLQVEPAPSRVAVPCDPGPAPIKAPALETLPPSAMVSELVPRMPTNNVSLLVQVEPVPFTITAPADPSRRPRIASWFEMLLPPLTLRMPVLVSPTHRFSGSDAVAPLVRFSVGLPVPSRTNMSGPGENHPPSTVSVPPLKLNAPAAELSNEPV